MTVSKLKPAAAEFFGTLFLTSVVVGSGIMAQRLAGGNEVGKLLANSVATAAGLVALILTFGSVSGAHFNPLVTLAFFLRREMNGSLAVAYCAAQILGAFAGIAVAHLMFSQTAFELSGHERGGLAAVFSESVASFGLLSVIFGTVRSQPAAVAYSVGGYILSAYWFTSSTSFANPALTLARAFTATYCGIRLQDVPEFVAGQCFGATAAVVLWGWLYPPKTIPEPS
jgi:glycerol uptake facilitator-like aquaporin